eukprot:TRINITY_DN6008_c0_g1_i1.p2 TRINITY_DN6008_c0_g1~~TRINITY_DN6008_c0_g1_i1.p2  ORF type:complete len:167 (-),score=31.61 TRINITY_DN6008_c0_g1_i1:343-843(-)
MAAVNWFKASNVSPMSASVSHGMALPVRWLPSSVPSIVVSTQARARPPARVRHGSCCKMLLAKRDNRADADEMGTAADPVFGDGVLLHGVRQDLEQSLHRAEPLALAQVAAALHEAVDDVLGRVRFGIRCALPDERRHHRPVIGRRRRRAAVAPLLLSLYTRSFRN